MGNPVISLRDLEEYEMETDDFLLETFKIKEDHLENLRQQRARQLTNRES